MEDIKLNILDCSFQRKMKPVQNISLIIFTLSWLFIFVFLFFNNRIVSILFYSIMVISIVSGAIAIVTSLFFFKRKIIGVIEIYKNKIILEDREFNDINDFYLDLNIEGSKVHTLDEEIIKKLPFWGNFFVNEKKDLKIEFEPHYELKKIVPHIKIKNTKRSALSMKTTDLFNNLMSLLWAAS